MGLFGKRDRSGANGLLLLLAALAAEAHPREHGRRGTLEREPGAEPPADACYTFPGRPDCMEMLRRLQELIDRG